MVGWDRGVNCQGAVTRQLIDDEESQGCHHAKQRLPKAAISMSEPL